MTRIYRHITPLEEEDLFVLTDFPGKMPDYPEHWHRQYELCMITGSRGHRTVGDSHEPFDGLDVVLIAPCLPHRWVSTTSECRITTLHFHEELAGCHLLSKQLFAGARLLLEQAARGVTFDDNAKPEICDRFLALVHAQRIEGALGFLSLLDFLARIPGRRLLSGATYHADGPAGMDIDDRIRLVCAYAEEHYAQPVRLSDVASLAGMTVPAFCHLFRKRTDSSFVDYLNGIRIGHATRMLGHKNASISDICRACGFGDASNFIREFRKRWGMTPSQYRAKALGLIVRF